MKTNFIAYLFFLSLLLWGCKKMDINSFGVTEKFFSVNQTLPIPVKRAMQELKRQNEITCFIEQFARNNGYPIWNKSVIEIKNPNNFSLSKDATVETPSETLVKIPLVREGENYVSSFIIAQCGESIKLNLYRENDYDIHPFGAVDSSVVTAERVIMELMEFNKQIYGYSKFSIQDTLLFKEIFSVSEDFELRTIEITEIKYETSKVYYAITCVSNKIPGNPFSCFEFSFEIDEPFQWPPDNPIEPEYPPGGGGGGGNGPINLPPPNCTNDPECHRGTEIIEGREPCGNCGPGPIIILLDPINYQQWMTDNIIDNTNNLCVSNTLITLKEISTKLPELICNIFGTSSGLDFDMTLTMENLGPGQGGNTLLNVNDNHFQVKINSYFTNATDLSVAATIIHEALHCQLLNWYREAYINNNSTRRDWLALNYGYLFSKETIVWDNNLAAIVYGANGASQHQDIATRYRDLVAITLYQFAIAKGILNVDLEFCKKLAMTGCEDSRYFTELTTYQQTQITDVCYPEKDPYGNNININNDPSKGNPCL